MTDATHTHVVHIDDAETEARLKPIFEGMFKGLFERMCQPPGPAACRAVFTIESATGEKLATGTIQSLIKLVIDAGGDITIEYEEVSTKH